MNEPGILIGFVSLGILIIIQIVMYAYGYGKLSQNVTNIDKRVDALTDRFERLDTRVDKLSK